MAVQPFEDNADLGSLVLAVGDSLVVSGKDTGNTTEITGGLDQSALGAGGLAFVNITRNFRANFGSASNPFIAEVNSGVSLFRNDAGAGELYYTPDGTCVNFRHRGPSWSHLIGTGAVTTLDQTDGHVTVASGITPATVEYLGGEMLIDGAGGTNPTTINCGGLGNGTLRTLRGFTTGNLFERGRLTLDCGTDAITTFNMWGGFLNWVSSGTVTTFNARGGDLSRLKFGRVTTITTLNVWPTVRGKDAFLAQRDTGMLVVTTLNGKD